MSASSSLSDEIGYLLLSLSQGLFKCDSDPDLNFVRLGLGEYVMELHQADYLIPEKRIFLMSEVLYCTDRDHLTKNQFFESVLGLKSSDEVRHLLFKVQNYVRNLGQKQTGSIMQSHKTETPLVFRPIEKTIKPDERKRTYENYLSTTYSAQPTFAEEYERMAQNKKSKTNEKKIEEWNFENFLHRIINDFYEFENNMEILHVSPDGSEIIYQNEERPDEERSLIDDLKSILYEGKTTDIPVGTLLPLLERILNVFTYNDKKTMPRYMLDNIIYLIEDYPAFQNHIINE